MKLFVLLVEDRGDEYYEEKYFGVYSSLTTALNVFLNIGPWVPGRRNNWGSEAVVLTTSLDGNDVESEVRYVKHDGIVEEWK